MSRLEKFRSHKNCVMQSKLLKRLSAKEVAECEAFILANDHLDKNAFTLAVNRWHLDSPIKPKHHTDMWALVLQSN